MNYLTSASSRLSLSTAAALTALFAACSEDTLIPAPPVATSVVLVAADAGEIHLTGTGNDFFYQSTQEVAAGTVVWQYTGGVASEVAPFGTVGRNRAFSPDITVPRPLSAHSVFTIRSGVFDQIQDVMVVDLATGIEDTITVDDRPVNALRHRQNDYPYISPNSELIAYQAFKPTEFAGIGSDSIDVHVYNMISGLTQEPTVTHGNRRRNFYPTFSSDGNWLVFVSNRTGTGKWELYGLAVDAAGVVDTALASLVQVTSTGGLITEQISGGVAGLVRPPLRWTPPGTAPVVAVLGADDILYLIPMGISGALQQVSVTGIVGTVQQFYWSEDGQSLAVTNFSTIYTVDLQGSATPVHTANQGDVVRDMTWSPDGLWITYRLQRGGIAWFELLDVGAGLLTEPAVITAVTSSNNVSTYGGRMDIRPAYSATNELYLLEFTTDGPLTPRVTLLDISGIVQ